MRKLKCIKEMQIGEYTLRISRQFHHQYPPLVGVAQKYTAPKKIFMFNVEGHTAESVIEKATKRIKQYENK